MPLAFPRQTGRVNRRAPFQARHELHHLGSDQLPLLVHRDHVARVFEHAEVQAATLATPIHDERELASTSVVKVVRNAVGDALYFSRSPVPNTAHAREGAASNPLGWRHVGVYAYRPDALARFCQLPVGDLEARESLEQLRWLEAGETMRVLDILRAPRGIDTLEDYREFVARLSGGGALPNLERTESR